MKSRLFWESCNKSGNLKQLSEPIEGFWKNSSIGLLATEGTLKTGIYNNFFDKNFNLVFPDTKIQKNSVNRAIKFVKMGDVKAASKIIKPAINYLMSKRCKKIILGCTE